jgi:hypothetical protein
MSFPKEEMDSLRSFCPSATELGEGGNVFIFLPGIKILSDSSVYEMDALLCPRSVPAYGGYPTRLFVEHPINGKGQNWATFYILGRSWHTPSWNYVDSALQLSQILAEHLRVYR